MENNSPAPFTVSSVSHFNTLTNNDLCNNFISGLAVIIIMDHLNRIFRGMLYASRSLNIRAIDRYQIFSRLSSSRYLLQVFTGREQRFTKEEISLVQHISIRYSSLVIPAIVLSILLMAELATIFAGTTIRNEHFAIQNFDPVININSRNLMPRYKFDSSCDDFFVRSRGTLQKGHVLKCVTNFSQPRTVDKSNYVVININYEDNTFQLAVTTSDSMVTFIRLKVFIQSIGSGKFQTAPFRPEKNETETNLLLRFVGNMKLDNTTDHGQNLPTGWYSEITREPDDRYRRVLFRYEHQFNSTREEISNNLIAKLRSLDLALNSTDMPWVFERENYYGHPEKFVIAVVTRNRVAHGLLLILAAVIILLQMTAVYFQISFEDVAYIAMKELIGDDCVLGPLTEATRTQAKVVPLSDLNTSDVLYRDDS